jgi:hypothetical protein
MAEKVGETNRVTPSVEERLAQLEEQNKRLLAENRNVKAQLRQAAFGDLPEEAEEAVQEKIRAGLTREQAIEVVKQQTLHDARLAEDAKKAKKNG